MNREEILERSRKENKNRDIAEIAVNNSASRIAAAAGMVLCMVISVLDWNLTKTINCGCWTVNFGILFTPFLIKYIKTKRTRELLIAIFHFLCFSFFCYGYIFNLVGAAK